MPVLLLHSHSHPHMFVEVVVGAMVVPDPKLFWNVAGADIRPLHDGAHTHK